MQTPTTAAYQFGQFEVNSALGELFKKGRRVKLQEQPFRLLVVLLENAGEVVTREELRSRIWPDDTFVDFDGSLRVAVRKLRDALGDNTDNPRYIETVPKRGYRFLGPAMRLAETTPLRVAANGVPTHSVVGVVADAKAARFRPSPWVLTAFVLFVVGITSTMIWLKLDRPRKALALTDKDTVVLGEFANTTGDSVFDGTLRQALAIELEQSPFLSLISDQRIRQTLRLMDQPPDAHLTPQIAHDVCRRTQSAAYLTGSIANLGGQYVLGLKAVSCAAGDVLAQEQETASGKERVLAALDIEAGKLRRKLGESLETVEKFDTPLDQATTPSLEALQVYTLGRKTQTARDEFEAAIPFLQRAVQLDPDFAMAYAVLGSLYWNTGETVRGCGYATKAYQLHAAVSEPEKFYIDTTYYHYVVGDLNKARQIYEVWEETYPRNSSAPIRLHQLYYEQARYQDALSQIRLAARIDPSKGGLEFSDIVYDLIALDRFQEAAATAQEAIAGGFDSSGLHLDLYQLAFLENDVSGMARQAESLNGNPDVAAQMLELRTQTAAYYGRLKESRDLSRQAVATATRAQESENAASLEANAALREALFGNASDVHHHRGSTPGAQVGRQAEYGVAMSFAISGDTARAQALADDLARRYPDDTLVQSNFLPTVRAQIALNRHHPSKAIDLLQSTAPYELSGLSWGFLGPVYVRGEAYLMAQRGAEAAAEFQKLVDHRGLVGNSPTGALAHLGLGRAYALMGNNTKARTQYQQFLNLWKDGDPDIPALRHAKTEYAKLK